MNAKLQNEHKHILNLIERDACQDGWTSVSEALFNHLSKNIPSELATFEKLEKGGRAKITKEGKTVLNWL